MVLGLLFTLSSIVFHRSFLLSQLLTPRKLSFETFLRFQLGRLDILARVLLHVNFVRDEWRLSFEMVLISQIYHHVDDRIRRFLSLEFWGPSDFYFFLTAVLGSLLCVNNPGHCAS